VIAEQGPSHSEISLRQAAMSPFGRLATLWRRSPRSELTQPAMCDAISEEISSRSRSS
jgi:hypothetical protein